MISIHSIYVGRPQTVHDASGTWRSSICRTRADGDVSLGLRGLAGDEVTDQRHHGKENQAVCCHPLAHYGFWKSQYGILLASGGVGENWTLAGADEAGICVHDVYEVGSARVRVSGPRVPCGTQARRVGRKDWVDLTLKELRTGFYLSVVHSGTVKAGDAWRLAERPHAGATLTALNRCVYHDAEPAVVERFLAIPDLDEYWRKKVAERRAG